jgi:hypothetical protein
MNKILTLILIGSIANLKKKEKKKSNALSTNTSLVEKNVTIIRLNAMIKI